MLTATGGLALNLNDWNWTSALGFLWANAGAANELHQLEATPLGGPDSIAVTVSGRPLPRLSPTNDVNWTYLAGSNAIVFPVAGGPPIGSELSISYPIGCR